MAQRRVTFAAEPPAAESEPSEVGEPSAPTVWEAVDAAFPAGDLPMEMAWRIQSKIRYKLRTLGWSCRFYSDAGWEGVIECFAIACLEHMQNAWGLLRNRAAMILSDPASRIVQFSTTFFAPPRELSLTRPARLNILNHRRRKTPTLLTTGVAEIHVSC